MGRSAKESVARDMSTFDQKCDLAVMCPRLQYQSQCESSVDLIGPLFLAQSQGEFSSAHSASFPQRSVRPALVVFSLPSRDFTIGLECSWKSRSGDSAYDLHAVVIWFIASFSARHR